MYRRMKVPLFLVVSVICDLVDLVGAQGNTTCRSDTNLAWYTDMVGETPCRTYERLRQICNPDYRVGSLHRPVPADSCDDDVADCCCNYPAFSLSLLCMNCQWAIGSDTGGNAGPGAYQNYTQRGEGFCRSDMTASDITSHSISDNIQSTICDNNIRIPDDLYSRIFWPDGSWFTVFTQTTLTTDDKAEGSFSHCADLEVSESLSTTSLLAPGTSTTSLLTSGTSTSAADSASTLAASPTASTTTSSKHALSSGAVAGIVIGSLAVLAALSVLVWLLCERRKKSTPSVRVEPFDVDPSIVQGISPFSSDGGSHIHPYYVSSTVSMPLMQSKPPVPYLTSGPPDLQQHQSQSSVSLLGTVLSTPKQHPVPLAIVASSPWQHPVARSGPERHSDGGPVLLERIPSGRLPPAYGEQY